MRTLQEAVLGETVKVRKISGEILKEHLIFTEQGRYG